MCWGGEATLRGYAESNVYVKGCTFSKNVNQIWKIFLNSPFTLHRFNPCPLHLIKGGKLCQKTKKIKKKKK